MGGYYTPSAVLTPVTQLYCALESSIIVVENCRYPDSTLHEVQGKCRKKLRFLNIILDSGVFSCCYKTLRHRSI